MSLYELKLAIEKEVERLIATKDKDTIMRLMEVAGWTPPPVDPDVEIALALTKDWRQTPISQPADVLALAAIKRGRDLSDAEAPSIDLMAKRFLAWNFPDDFNPSGGILFNRFSGFMPSGTSLLSYGQAKEMVRFMLGLPEDAA